MWRSHLFKWGRLLLYMGPQKQELWMSTLKTQDQELIILSKQDYLPILVESFLITAKLKSYLARQSSSIKRNWNTSRSSVKARQWHRLRNLHLIWFADVYYRVPHARGVTKLEIWILAYQKNRKSLITRVTCVRQAVEVRDGHNPDGVQSILAFDLYELFCFGWNRQRSCHLSGRIPSVKWKLPGCLLKALSLFPYRISTLYWKPVNRVFPESGIKQWCWVCLIQVHAPRDAWRGLSLIIMDHFERSMTIAEKPFMTHIPVVKGYSPKTLSQQKDTSSACGGDFSFVSPMFLPGTRILYCGKNGGEELF